MISLSVAVNARDARPPRPGSPPTRCRCPSRRAALTATTSRPRRARPSSQRRHPPGQLAAAQLVRLGGGHHVRAAAGRPATPAASRRPPSARGARRPGTRTGPGARGPTRYDSHQALPALPHRLRHLRVAVSGQVHEVQLVAHAEEVHESACAPACDETRARSLRPGQGVQQAALADVRTAQERDLGQPVARELLAAACRRLPTKRRPGVGSAQCVRPSGHVARVSGSAGLHRLLLGRSGGRHQGDLQHLVDVLDQLHRHRVEHVLRDVGQVLLVLARAG